MEKRKIRRLVIACLLVAFVLGSVPAVLAATVGYYSRFPRYQDHVTITAGEKLSEDSTEAVNRITGPSNATCGYFWVDRDLGSGQITPTTYCKIGLNSIFYNADSNYQGDVYLRGQAASWDINTHEVSGTVDFG
jgi:hypothetical protein